MLNKVALICHLQVEKKEMLSIIDKTKEKLQNQFIKWQNANIMCIFKSDKFKSQIMRDKMMVKQCGLYWTKIQTNCVY